MTTAIVLHRNDSALTASFAEEAIALRDSALESAALIGTVRTAQQQEVAVKAQLGLREVIAGVEKARKAAKQPIIDYGRAIDSTAAKFIEELQTELTRVSTLIGDFQTLEAKRVAAAEAAARLEARRIEDERRAREDAERARLAEEQRRIEFAAAEARRKAKEEQDKIDAEAAKLAREARNKAERERAEIAAKEAEIKRLQLAEKERLAAIELERQKAMAEAASHEALDKINTEADIRVREEIKPVEANRVEGQTVKHEWQINITNIWDLARAHPGCVKIEPRIAEIKALLNSGVTRIPGVTATKQIVASVRLNGKAAIDV